jgi:hypothetical protein
MRPIALFAISAAALGGCATPYSKISGDRYFRVPIDTYPLEVVSVDGRHPLYEPARVEPGTHEVKVRALPTPSQHVGTAKTYALDVKPCTLYYLVAVKPTRLHTDYTVKVGHEQPVPGCSRTP